MKRSVDIILPVFREEENIEKLYSSIQKNVSSPHRLLFVYDSDTDPTVAILRRMQKNTKTVLLVKNMFGSGIVNALKTGFRTAKSEIIIIMMADLSDNPKDVDTMVRKISEGYDVICASRYSGSGKRIGGSYIKGLLSYIGCKTLRILTGIPTDDATNAFKCFRRSFLSGVTVESTGGFELPLELTVKAYLKGKKIIDIPTVWRERRKGKSKFKLFRWFPQYVRWYILALRYSIAKGS